MLEAGFGVGVSGEGTAGSAVVEVFVAAVEVFGRRRRRPVFMAVLQRTVFMAVFWAVFLGGQRKVLGRVRPAPKKLDFGTKARG